MTTVHVDAEQSAGTATVVADPDTSGFHIQVPDATIEVSQAQLTTITQAAMALLGVSTGAPVKPAFFTDSNGLPRPGVTEAQTFPALMSAALGTSTYGVFAVAGDTSGYGLARIQAVIDYAPTDVFLDFGVNDADPVKAVTALQYETSMREIISRLNAKGIRIWLMSPIFIAQTGYLERQRDTYMPVWQKLARIEGLIVVDCHTKMAAVTMQKSRADFDALAVDAQHWSAAGNAWRVNRCKEVRGI